MICKEDVVSWFKELESYKRIDTMCTLLNMCLPFELRFLGTCLEELGRRDSQELRGIELRVNNPQELTADIASCQSGEPSDMKIRRKMALYLALIRAVNLPCINELFRTLDGWGERDFVKFGDGDPLQELLLVYTMATNHPVFSFEQRMKCGEIFTKIQESKTINTQKTTTSDHEFLHPHSHNQQHQSNILSHHLHQHHHLQQQSPPIPSPPSQSQPTPVQLIAQPTAMTMGFTQQLLTNDNNMMGQQMDVLQQMQLTPTMLPPDFAVAPPWNVRPIQLCPPNLEAMTYPPPQPSSPLLSQPSSPAHSRTGSPTRASQQQQTMHRNNQQQQRQTHMIKTSRRPSVETTPPPQSAICGIEYHLKPLDDMVLNVDGALSQLSQLQTNTRNGYVRPLHHTIPRQSNKSNHMHHHLQQQQQQHHQLQQQLQLQQQQQQQQQQSHSNLSNNYNPSGLSYTIQSMSLMDMHHGMENNTSSNSSRHKSAGSDSGSSIGSASEISPPETPSILQNQTNMRFKDQQYKPQQQHQQQQINMNRINGRPDKVQAGSIIYSTNVNPGLYNTNSGDIMLTGSQNIISNNNNNNNTTSTNINNNNNNNNNNNVNNNNNNGNNLSNNNNNNNSSSNNNNSNNNNNNNIVTNAVLLSGGNNGSNVVGQSPGGIITSTSSTTNQQLLMQQSNQQQAQFSATYPYHAQQHLVTSSRPPLISHTTTLPPPTTFRPPTYQMANGDIYTMCPFPQQGVVASGVTYLRTSQSPGTQQHQQQQQQQQPGSIVTSGGIGVPIQAIQIQTTPYPIASCVGSTGGKVILSCFNCGSQAHVGRDCQEASMEDVTRGSIYKLDYNQLSASSSQPMSHHHTLTIGGGGVIMGGGNTSTSSNNNNLSNNNNNNISSSSNSNNSIGISGNNNNNNNNSDINIMQQTGLPTTSLIGGSVQTAGTPTSTPPHIPIVSAVSPSSSSSSSSSTGNSNK